MSVGAVDIHGVYLTSLRPGRYFGHTPSQPTPYAGFVFALRGQAVFTFNGTPYELTPGLVAHGAKGMTLRVDVGSSGFDYALIHYTLSAPPEEPEGYTGAHFVLETGINPRITELLYMLETSVTTPGHLQAVRTKELFYSTIYETFSCARNRMNRESRNAVEHVLDYIHTHYTEPLNLEKLAGLADMDIKKFAYAFHKYAGVYPIDYLIQHRMSRARVLLATSSAAVKNIAESIGYGDAHYFSRLFKKYTGCTPSEFRARNGNNPPLFE